MPQISPAVGETGLVSVIVPAYNAERFIARTLDSVLSQTYTRLEVLVADDGSRDRTAQIVAEYARRDRRVRLLQQQNAGVSAARNLAIHHSCGEFIAPVDADDLWYPQKLEKQVQRFAEVGAGTGLIYTWCAMIDEEDRLTGRWSGCHLEGDVFWHLIYRNIVGNASSPLIRRCILEQVGLYNLALKVGKAQGAEDWDLYLRIAEHCSFGLVPEVLTGYRQVAGSMSRNYAAMEMFIAMVLEDVRRRHPEIPDRLFRWARSERRLSFSKSNRQFRNYRGSLEWLLRAALIDPGILLRREFYRLLAADALWSVAPSTNQDGLADCPLTPSELEVRVRGMLATARDRYQVRVEKLRPVGGLP